MIGRFITAVCLCAMIGWTTVASAFVSPVSNDTTRAQVAYDSFIARFWFGPAATGRLYRMAAAPYSAASTTTQVNSADAPAAATTLTIASIATGISRGQTVSSSVAGLVPNKTTVSAITVGASTTTVTLSQAAGLNADAPPGTPFTFTSPPNDPPVCTGCLWEYGMGVQVLYARWKVAGDPDALTRLKAMWSFVKTYWSVTTMGTCGTYNVAGPVAGSAQDDMAWASFMMVALYEATGDPIALTYAKAAMDCAWNRWWDSETGGGLWYDDSHAYFAATAGSGDVKTVPAAGSAGNPLGYGAPQKSSYQAPLAYAMMQYSIDANDSSYLTKAEQIDTWASTSLTVGRNGDGLYWCSIYYDGSAFGAAYPYQINKGGSVVMLAGDMAFAALDAKLATLTTGATSAAYQARAIATAQGLYAYERIGNVFLNARDAYVDGWAAYLYAVNVVPLLTGMTGVADASTILATARSVGTFGRTADGTYSADWDGTVSAAWTMAPSQPYYQNVTANGVIWPIVGQMFGH